MQFAEVFLHTCRLELKGSHRQAVAVKLIGCRILNIDFIEVYIDAETVVDVSDSFVEDTQGFQSEEVHLDEACILDNGTFILGAAYLLARLLVIGGGDGYPVTDIIATDNDSAGVNARVANITFQHLSIAYGVAHQRIGGGRRLLHFGNTGDDILQIHLAW